METMRERFTAVTTDLLAEHPRLAVVLADISADSFQPAATRHPDRVINVGIREQLLISVAGGLSLTGIRPIAHTFASFLVERPFEQIKLDLNHQGAQAGAVLVSAGASYDNSGSGRTHQSPGDVALLGTLPGWTVHVPGHPDEAERQIRAAARGTGLVYVRLSTEANAVPLDGEPGRSPCCAAGAWAQCSRSARWPTPWWTRPSGWTSPCCTRPPSGRWTWPRCARACRLRTWSWSSPTWRAPRCPPWPRRCATCRTGSSGWGSAAASCAGTARLPSIRPRTAWTPGRCGPDRLVPAALGAQ